MKKISILFLSLFIGCATTKPPIPLTEYQGEQLNISKDYSIHQVGGGSTIFTIAAPDSEKILVNLYEPNGKLGITLYKGNGAILAISLAKTFDKYDYQLKPGLNKIIVFGEKGKAVFNLTAQ